MFLVPFSATLLIIEVLINFSHDIVGNPSVQSHYSQIISHFSSSHSQAMAHKNGPHPQKLSPIDAPLLKKWVIHFARIGGKGSGGANRVIQLAWFLASNYERDRIEQYANNRFYSTVIYHCLKERGGIGCGTSLFGKEGGSMMDVRVGSGSRNRRCCGKDAFTGRDGARGKSGYVSEGDASDVVDDVNSPAGCLVAPFW